MLPPGWGYKLIDSSDVWPGCATAIDWRYESLPLDPFKYCAKALSLGRVDHLHEPHPAIEVLPEGRMSVAVLALRTQPHTVGECRLETIEIGAYYIHPLIGDQARQMLPHALAHDARLAVVYDKTLLVQNGGDMGREPLHAPLKCFAPGKCQIVGVPRVLGACRFRQARHAAIHPVGAKIGQSRRDDSPNAKDNLGSALIP